MKFVGENYKFVVSNDVPKITQDKWLTRIVDMTVSPWKVWRRYTKDGKWIKIKEWR